MIGSTRKEEDGVDTSKTTKRTTRIPCILRYDFWLSCKCDDCRTFLSLYHKNLLVSVHAATCRTQPDVVELLWDYGGDINTRTNNMETPLGESVVQGN